jgi:predicted nucleotidyltransferase
MASRVQQYLDAVAQLHPFGVSSLVSVILFGSAASGGFSESSDVDLIIVLPDEATLEDRRRLRGVVADLEITHGLRLPSNRRKNPLEMFAEHAGGDATPLPAVSDSMESVARSDTAARLAASRPSG